MMRSRFASIARRLAALVGAAVIVVTIGSCSDPSIAPISVTRVELTPASAVLRAGESVTLQARALDTTGNAVAVPVIAWSSSNKSVATVSASGVVSALSAGDARIAASVFGRSAVTNITVTPRVVASVVVVPAAVSMRVGVAAPLQVQTLDAEGSVLTGRIVAWTSSNTAVATVSGQGVVTGASTGAATISATCEGRVGQAAVTVTLAPVQSVTVSPGIDTLGIGTERQHSATLRDASGAILTGRVLSWSSSNAAVASVSSTGVATGLSPGTATITAASEGRVGAATVVVLARLAGTVSLTPATATLTVGTTVQLTVQVTDSLGNLLTGRPVGFASSAPSVASVSATGLVAALAPGSTRVTATSEGRSGSTLIDVIPVPVATVQITPATVSLLTGATQQLAAVARASDGAELLGRDVTWTSGAPAIARVSTTGLVTSVAPGIAIVLATVDGVSAMSEVRVRLPTIATITIAPPSPAIALFEQVQLAATPRDASGAALTGRSITWASDNETIAFVSSGGLVVGFKLGTARITATSEGVSASTTVTVR